MLNHLFKPIYNFPNKKTLYPPSEKYSVPEIANNQQSTTNKSIPQNLQHRILRLLLRKQPRFKVSFFVAVYNNVLWRRN